MTDDRDHLLAQRLRREVGREPTGTAALWSTLEGRATATPTADDGRRPGRRLATVAAAVVVLVAGAGLWAVATDHHGGRPTRTTATTDLGPEPTTTSTTSTTGAVPPPPDGWPPGTLVLPADDPVVRAVLALLPAGAELTEALDVSGATPADYVLVRAALDGAEYEVSIHRVFDESVLSEPTLVPEGKIWPGATSATHRYLYVLSTTDVGLYLAVTGTVPPGADEALRDLARRVIADPVLGQVTTQ